MSDIVGSIAPTTSVEVTQKRQKTSLKLGLSGNHGKSEVWNYFTKHLDEESGKYKELAECVFCNAKITTSSTSGTNKLYTHIKFCKKISRDQEDKSQYLISLMTNQVSNWTFDQDKCRKALAKMIILCKLPFSVVENEGFRLFCLVMQPKFHVLGRITVTKDCLQMFHKEKIKLKDYLKDTSTRVSITIEMWTSIQNLGYSTYGSFC